MYALEAVGQGMPWIGIRYGGAPVALTVGGGRLSFCGRGCELAAGNGADAAACAMSTAAASSIMVRAW